jgi:diadenosine tetraphosphatase ApaH/serine/threonine PP2A family protein phosphatase
MLYLILSDIHSNIDALDQVLADAARFEDSRILLLGDLVGYGAEPNAVIDRLRSLPVAAAIRGNHDRVAGGLGDAGAFNDVARASARATARLLTEESRDYLRGLPPGPMQVSSLIEICHGTPLDEDEYIFDEMDAVYAIRSASRPVCLFGHTHAPFAMRMAGEEVDFVDVSPGARFALEDGVRYLVNVGSVGQPRDGDPRAAYGILDSDARTLTCHRVAYPVERAQQRIREAGFPDVLARRLSVGR